MTTNRLQTITNRLLPKSRFARGVTVLASGTALGQAIVVLASPILTRLYTPDDFGVLAVYAAFLGILTVVASLRYQLAIPLPTSDGTAANILALSLICVGGVTVIVTLLVTLLGSSIVVWTNTPILEPYLWLLPVGVALGGSYQAFNYWAVRKRAFTRIASTKLYQGGGSVATQIGLGLAQFGTVGLILGQVVGQAAGLINLVRSTWREDRSALNRIRADRVRWAARRYRRFPAYSTWSGLANTTGAQLPPILFAALFSPAIAGLYMLANRVIHIPMNLIGQAVGQVFHSSAAEARRENRLDSTTFKTFEALARIGTGPLVIFAVVAPEIFAIVFGASWYQAGVYVQILIPMILLQFVFSPLSKLFSIMELQHGGLVFQTALLLARVLGVFTGALFGEPLLAIGLYAGLSSFIYLGAMIWIFRQVGLGLSEWLKKMLVELVVALPVLVVVWWMKVLTLDNPGAPGFWMNVGLILIVIGSFVLFLFWRVIPHIHQGR